MSAELFDSHCHVNEERFDEDRNSVLERMLSEGVTRYAVIGSDIPTSRACVSYAGVHDGCWAAVGVHPHEASGWRSECIEELSALCRDPKVRAIGEIGLDYHYDYSPRDVQKKVAAVQIELAWILNKPIVWHIREAHGDALQLMLDQRSRLTGGIIHCFSGSPEIAAEYLKLGYYISFAGPVTFIKAPKLVEAARLVPMDRLLIETDSPYLAPEPMRGRRNEPANVRYVCQKLAEIRGVSFQEMAAATTTNAMRVYQIDPE